MGTATLKQPKNVPIHVGSPFGFTKEDQIAVAEARADKSRLIVVIGHQWKSKYFNTAALRKNLKAMFAKGLATFLSGLTWVATRTDYRGTHCPFGRTSL